MEETGWIISAPKRLGAFRRFTYMPEYDLHAEKLCTIYAAAPIYKRCDPLEDDHNPVWADMETALSLLGNDGDAHFLERFMALNGLL
jgi:8-oxo-dGTP diphosphatase